MGMQQFNPTAPSRRWQRTAWTALVLICLAIVGLPATSPAAEKLFDFGDLNVDLSKVQAKPSAADPAPVAAPIKQQPGAAARQHAGESGTAGIAEGCRCRYR
jgi:hypothetical protein